MPTRADCHFVGHSMATFHSMAFDDAGADVYLDSTGLAATELAFGMPPNVTVATEAPSSTVWVIADRACRVLGRNDVLGIVLGDPAEPMHSIRTTIGTVKWWKDDKGYGLLTSEETGPWDMSGCANSASVSSITTRQVGFRLRRGRHAA